MCDELTKAKTFPSDVALQGDIGLRIFSRQPNTSLRSGTSVPAYTVGPQIRVSVPAYTVGPRYRASVPAYTVGPQIRASVPAYTVGPRIRASVPAYTAQPHIYG